MPAQESIPPNPDPAFSQLVAQAQSLVAQGRPSDAVALYRQWLCTSGTSPGAHIANFNLGVLLAASRHFEEAEAAYQRALELVPDFIHPKVNLGHLYEAQGLAENALQTWSQVLTEPAPQKTGQQELLLHALNSSAHLLEKLTRLDEAAGYFERSLQLKADQPSVLRSYVNIRQRLCLWPVYKGPGTVTENQLLMNTAPVSMLAATDDPALQLLAASRNASNNSLPSVLKPVQSGPRREGRIRLGYLSGDLGRHAVGMLTAELFALHDRSNFEVFGFCWTKEDGSRVRQRIVQGLDHLVRLDNMNDQEAARQIAARGIDVLIDLQGPTQGTRPAILAQRPAPVQATFLGFPGTTAQAGVEYVIADEFVVPPQLQPYMTERPLHVPGCYQPSDRQREIGPLPRRQDVGLPGSAFVFCSFNQTLKLTPEVFGAWMRVVSASPNSVLWLLADSARSRRNLQDAWQTAGLSPERLIFADRVAHAHYLARLPLADVFLDSFPFNAGTTANDSLWMGVPVLTLCGRTFASRMAASQLLAVGLPELITDTLSEYENVAANLARNHEWYTLLRQRLMKHGRASPLFDMPAFVRGLEQQLTELVTNAGLPLRA